MKSITIKAVGSVTAGMIRLYIQKPNPTRTVLFKEIQVPTSPFLAYTPTPNPVLPTYETILTGDIRIENGCSLVASIQNSESFNFIVDSLSWDYPSTLPTTCCNFMQVSSVTGIEVINVANHNLDGSGTISTVFTASSNAGSNGTLVKTVIIKALQSTSINGMIRLFVSDDNGSTFYLMKEIPVGQTIQSSIEPSYKDVVELNLHLQPGYIIGASTENAQNFAISIEGEEWSYPI